MWQEAVKCNENNDRKRVVAGHVRDSSERHHKSSLS